nr:hypothetical protein [Tanacetum cinerariifolium]
MIHDSVLNGPLIWPTIEVDGVTRPKPYEELSEKEKIQADCDLKATNIVLQGLPHDSFAGMETKGNATRSGGNNTTGQARVVKCYTCHGKWHMARQYTQPKRPRNSAWFKEKMLLVQAQESSQTTITHNAAFQTDDLDAYDSGCDDISSAKLILLANLSSYDSDVLSDVPQHDIYQNDDMINQSYLQEMQNAIIQDTNSSAQQDAMIRKNGKNRIGTDFPVPVTGTRISFGTVPVPLFYAREKIDTTDAVRVRYHTGTMLIPSIMISKKHDVIFVDDSEETLILAEESRSK